MFLQLFTRLCNTFCRELYLVVFLYQKYIIDTVCTVTFYLILPSLFQKTMVFYIISFTEKEKNGTIITDVSKSQSAGHTDNLFIRDNFIVSEGGGALLPKRTVVGFYT